jgi:hypothetical protein
MSSLSRFEKLESVQIEILVFKWFASKTDRE